MHTPVAPWRRLCCCLVLLAFFLPASKAKSPNWSPPANKSEWRSRTVYQILVDRFDLGTKSSERCGNFNQYCGGLWKGITAQIPYIKDLGFDAVWITPIHKQSGGPDWQYPDGYHGYWPKDLWALNEQFGRATDLERMIDSLHDAGIWTMLDVVPNHVGYGALSDIAVFNQSDYYHSCDGCQIGCAYSNANDQQVRQCRLSNLPDLNQDHPYVAQKLMDWHTSAYKQWQIDAYRVDAAKHVEIPWLRDLKNNVSIFTIGEFAASIQVIFDRLSAKALDSSLNFHLHGSLMATFGQGEMFALYKGIEMLRQLFGPNSTLPEVLPLMGNYLENHDNPRFLCLKNDIRRFENGHAFVLFAEGIPIVYYGAELALRGVRDPLWPTKYGTKYKSRGKDYRDFEMYKFLQILIGVRKARQVWDYPMNILNVTGPLADNIFAIERGGVVLILNNFDKSMEDSLTNSPVQMQISGLPVSLRGVMLSNALFPFKRFVSKPRVQLPDTVLVDGAGNMTFTPDPKRFPQVYLGPGPAYPGVGVVGSGIEPFIEYEAEDEGLGAAGIALVVFWVMSAVLCLLVHLALRGWFSRTQPYQWMVRKLGRQPADKATSSSSDDIEEEPHTPSLPLSPFSDPTDRAAVKVVVDGDAGRAADASGSDEGLHASHDSSSPVAGVVLAAGDVAPQHTTLTLLPETQPHPAIVSIDGAVEDRRPVDAALPQVPELPEAPVSETTLTGVQQVTLHDDGVGATGGAAAGRRRPMQSAFERIDVATSVAAEAGPIITNPTYLDDATPRIGATTSKHSGTVSVPGAEQSSLEMSPEMLVNLPSHSHMMARGLMYQGSLLQSPGRHHLLTAASGASSGSAAQPASPGGTYVYPNLMGPVGMMPTATSLTKKSLLGRPSLSAATSLNVPVGAQGSGRVEALALARQSAAAAQARRQSSDAMVIQNLNPTRKRRSSASHLAVPEGPGSRGSSTLAQLPISSSHPVQMKSAGGKPAGLPALMVPPSPGMATIDMMPSIMSAAASSLRVYAPFQAPPDLVLHVAMEYSVPHTGLEFMFGGLGKVVDIFLRYWPGPIGLCAPLYASAYNDHEKDNRPKFFPPGSSPAMKFTLSTSRELVPVDVFMLQQDNITYFFIQADIFKHRELKTIYAFEKENEMLTWVSIMSQVTSIVISEFQIRKVQFHDWHGTLALQYLQDKSQPEVLLVLHNAHYNGKFKVPDDLRRVYVYGMFNLDTGIFPRHLEYQGCVNMLHGALKFLRKRQGGVGCVAVSPRYAELVLQKLDVMWQMRSERKVVGILNALPFIDCLAAEVDAGNMSLQEVVRYKAERKIEFQKRFGLNVSDESVLTLPFSGPQLVVSLGRMTHQKGSDIIAMAADEFLAACPRCQLVMVGPSGDKTGTEAQILLSKVAEKYPGRVYAPKDKYFASEEKKLLIDAADFCLMPSRFEPCGLVDIEFGWNGALCIGHNTGGLGKMPGLYYEVQTSARRHLAAKLSKAVMDAMDIGPETRLDLLLEAVSTRFPVDEMMAKYQEQWDDISRACQKHQEEKDAIVTAAEEQQNQYFDQLWLKQNKKDENTAQAAKIYDKGRVLNFMHTVFGVDVGRHDLSFKLLLFLEAFCKLPAYMVTGFFVQTYLGYTTITGCQSQWDASWGVFPEMMNSLAFRVLLSYGVYTIAAPVWMIIAMRSQPKRYIIGLVWATALSAIMAHACMYWTVLINPAIMVTSILSPMGVALLPMNFLGKDVEVSETGFKYMIVVELGTSMFMFTAALLAVFSRNNLPFVITNGFTVLAALLYLAWFTAPNVLHHSFAKERFAFTGQWKHILSIASFWLTSLVMVCENVALILTAYSTLLNFSLVLLMLLIAVVFGARVLSLFTTYLIMNLKCSRLHVQDMMMLIATLPGFAIAKQLAVQYGTVAGVMSVTAAVEFVFGSRFQLVGLLAFETLPSRELVAVWQLTTMVVSTIVPALVLALGYTTQTDFRNTTGLLIGVCVCEGVRLLAMIALKYVHKRENLASL